MNKEYPVHATNMFDCLPKSYPDIFGSIGKPFIKPKFKPLAAKDMKSIQVEVERRKMIMGHNTIQLDSDNYPVYGGKHLQLNRSLAVRVESKDGGKNRYPAS